MVLESSDRWHPASKEVNKTVRESVRRIFSQLWHSWSEIPEDHRQVMFEEFKRNAGAKLRNWLERVRRTGNVAQWLLKIVYDDLCIYWESPEYKAISKQNKKARASLKDGSLHIGGAKSVRVIVREMEEDLGREPTRLEVFKRTHLLKKMNESNPNVWVEPRAENVNNEFIRYLSEFGST
ncbi:uncharacterized protein LOC107847621 isoform X3 [Capsicum annuum]|uniref:uncharacterized protein LOC107847621 isoform X3 n=1 Tax=Capsicum annuum TaxID=4072 RepID=UPI0007BFC55B|nr:uncharacterized protein LOC107847621 isoform X3 [Capsicum annuum]XP_047255393.1 uncharacterized protein LOC107847621 isoform X3 [Capsicum annuum]XP_047255394.1 uncharacterized protein LOC107847621 isoform X3 [Capsicum annuum]XP_047255395.1 uncharacterized protein LOC107847621 isoform X3 [Capsicum annuum]XP_047255396.1 uncharacterized protein LOC107847621 isoform X3 [Capsicum annuum]